MRTSVEIQKDLDEAKEEMWLLTRHRRNQDYVHKDSEYISEYNKQIKHIHNLQINLNQAKQREWMRSRQR